MEQSKAIEWFVPPKQGLTIDENGLQRWFMGGKLNTSIKEKDLEIELIKMVRKKVGPVASFRKSVITRRLPKTRSGKILRATMRAISDGKSFSIPSTIEDPTVLEELKLLMTEKEIRIQ